MGDSTTIKWGNNGRWGTTSTEPPKLGIYTRVIVSTQKSREQERVLALNLELKKTP